MSLIEIHSLQFVGIIVCKFVSIIPKQFKEPLEMAFVFNNRPVAGKMILALLKT